MSIYATDENKKLYKISGGSGTKVTLNGQGQKEWSADFAENERQKSKNLARIENGVAKIDGMTITSNNGTVSFNGTTTKENTISLLGSNGITRPNAYYEGVIISTGNSIKLKAGTYTISWSGSSSLVILYGDLGQKMSTGATRVEIGTNYTITFNQDVYLCLLKYFGVSSHSWTINDVQIESGDTKTSYQTYTGQITHNGDPSVIFAEEEMLKSKNLFRIITSKNESQHNVSYNYDSETQELTINGTVSSGNSTWFVLHPNREWLTPGTYTFHTKYNSGSTVNSGFNGIFLYFNDGISDLSSYSMGIADTHKTITFTKPVYLRAVSFQGDSGTKYNNYKIQFQLETGDTPTEWQPYNGAIVHENDIQRHIITGHLLADYNPGTTNYTVIPLVQYSKIGNRLTMNSNGGVVVGTGVTNVMVSAGVGIYVANVGYHYISIYKNNKMIATEYVQTKDTSGRNITFSIYRFLLPVSEGDIITFEFRDSAGNGLQSSNLQTQMTVEVVE